MDRLQLLEVFQRVAESQSFTKAAVILDLPRSTITQAVQRLEQQLGAQLLVRTTRRVQLTDEGQTILKQSAQMLQDWEEFAQQFSLNKHLSGRLRVSMPSRFARKVVIPALGEFQRRYPAIELVIHVADYAVDLVAEGIDLAIYAGELPDSNLIGYQLGQLPIKTLASPYYLQRFGIPHHPEQLSSHQMVGYVLSESEQIEPLEFYVDGKYQYYRLAHPVTTNGSDAYFQAAITGLGLIQSPTYGVREQLDSGQLVEVLADYPAAALPISLVYPKKRYSSRRLQVFIEYLKLLLNHFSNVSS
ncbi:LysR family transcriptional regulator [Celerinatantimonas yamalensis]|uniref:LysR family transcriptional regulator n=1 Tax=Celerinatantimonas yamalensis TaxID=559956 RepID=A0ABW9G1I0_9GAMM